ncbi:hypothetical protein GCM10027341_22240 [Spirosoma knui]
MFLLVCQTGAFGQKKEDPAPSVKFGKISPDQFLNRHKDSTAEAVVLYDVGQVSFEESSNELWQVFTHHIRIKILKKSAYDRATIQLPIRRGVSGQHEYVSDFEGFTYNLNSGDVSINAFDKKGHFTEKASDTYSIEKYTLPNVREGSIIEYKYQVHTPFSIGYNPRTWRFQQSIPVNWSEYRITIPDYFFYKIMQGGYLSLAINEHKPANVRLITGQPDVGAVAYRFAVKDAPAFRDEAYITTDDDYLSKIDFELASYQLPGGMIKNFSVSWEALDKTLLDHPDFGGQIKRTGFLRETAKTLLSQHSDTLARITAAYDFVRQRIKWNDQSSVWSTSIKKVFDDRKGDAADINLLLIALLREMDIEVHPVILSTRDHGRISEDYALLRRFNYVVASVPVGGKDMLLDATDAYIKPGMLPVHCLNGTGRLIHPTQARFVSLAPFERDIEAYTAQFTLDAEGEVAGTITHSHAGYSAWNARKEIAVGGKVKYLEEARKKRASWQIENADFFSENAQNNTFTATYTLAIPEACTRAGDRLYFRPLLTEAHGSNTFKEAQRLYPVDFGVLIDETFTAVYTLPEGYQIEELPKPVNMSLPDNAGRFIYSLTPMNGNQVQIISRVSLRKTMYFADEYPALREFFNQIIAKHAEQVVLKRGTLAQKN